MQIESNPLEEIRTNFNLRNTDREYNLLADKNSVPFIFVNFSGVDWVAIFERTDYGYGCIL